MRTLERMVHSIEQYRLGLVCSHLSWQIFFLSSIFLELPIAAKLVDRVNSSSFSMDIFSFFIHLYSSSKNIDKSDS
jgi:hypothetical protein